MKQAIIDIGSNSIRLTLYEIQGNTFRILFREKVMAGLAGYIEDGKLNMDGIECACEGLLKFRSTLETLEIENINTFATASLRNISNTSEALSVINAATGYNVEIISGEDEALFGYFGVTSELNLSSGVFIDIGGASTEIVIFEDGNPDNYNSFTIGSLSLYRNFVKKILPGKSSIKDIKQEIKEKIDIDKESISPHDLLIGVGGTLRATLKLSNQYHRISDESTSMTSEQLDELCAFLLSGKKEACDMILKHEADRIHTIIPGILILQHVVHLFEAKQLIVGRYGVREGYLCQRIIKKNTIIPKIVN